MNEHFTKRVFEVACACAGLFMFGPLLCTTALVVWICDGDPVLFAQTRVGKSRQPFRLYKFRTMRDGEVTHLGGLLRATGIDELPQLVNVIRGDMSLVGPRPLTVEDIHRLRWAHERFDPRWSVRPGLTGLAQLQPSTRCDARLSWVCDRAYVREPSVLGDVKIVAASLLCMAIGKTRTQDIVRRFVRRSS